MTSTANREELKAILDAWIPKYIRQVVELRSGGKLTAERYNELMNLLITQGDDTIELAETVKQYVEILVNEMSAEFKETTELVTNLANTAVNTANNAVATVEEYKSTIDRDIASFKEVVNRVTSEANTNASEALSTANQLVQDMVAYKESMTTQINQTFTEMRNALGTQVSDEIAKQMQGIQETLTTSINASIETLSEELLVTANNIEQSVNTAIQDIDAYKTAMDVRLNDALREVEESLSVAGDVIRDAATIYNALEEMRNTVDSFENRLSNVEQYVATSDDFVVVAFGNTEPARRNTLWFNTGTVTAAMVNLNLGAEDDEGIQANINGRMYAVQNSTDVPEDVNGIHSYEIL